MQDILVERCTLRVVRRGGWSWGADPRRLLRNVIDAVPALVAARLAELLRDAPPGCVITDPVSIRIPVRLAELRDRRAVDDPGTADAGAPWMARVRQAIDEAVEAIELAPGGDEEHPDVRPLAPHPLNRSSAREVLLGSLLEWQESGTLAAVLADAGEDCDEVWLRALHEGAALGVVTAGEGDPAATTPEETSAVLTPAPMALTAVDRLAAYVVRLAAAGKDESIDAPRAARTEEGGSAPPVPAQRGVAAAVVRERTSEVVPPKVEADSRQTAGAHLPPSHLHTDAAPRPLVGVEVRVPSALPWLLLVPLHKLGYLRALGAALDIAGLEPRAGLFGAALAYKMTTATDRAWKKSAAVDHLAATMAAGYGAVSTPDLDRFARRIASQCALLDGTLAHAIVQGRTDDEPWFIQRVSAAGAGSFAVIDPEGVFPAWWGASAPVAADAVHASAGAVAMVPEDAAVPDLMRCLDAAGVRFVTTARPGRGESWARLPSVDGRAWWSNRAGPVPTPVRRRMARFDDLAPRAELLGVELGERRTALPLAPTCALEQSLALAVAAALGTIAWELWHARETTDPLLALTRFEDLDARVRFTEDAVRVVVPLGRRHRDLYEAGLLAGADDVPWFGGRRLEFSGG